MGLGALLATFSSRVDAGLSLHYKLAVRTIKRGEARARRAKIRFHQNPQDSNGFLGRQKKTPFGEPIYREHYMNFGEEGTQQLHLNEFASLRTFAKSILLPAELEHIARPRL